MSLFTPKKELSSKPSSTQVEGLTISRLSPHGQLRKTRARLRKNKDRAKRRIRDVKERDIKRRKKHVKKQKNSVRRLYKAISKERRVTSTKRAAIEMNWDHITRQVKNASALHKEIQKQKERCDEVMKKKNSVIKDLQEDLQKKDDAYVKLLQEQELEVEEYHRNMEEEVLEIQSKYREEIKKVEESYEQRRIEIMEQQEKNYESKLKYRTEKEERNLIDRMKLHEDGEDNANQERQELLEKYANTKEKMEQRVQSLEKDLDHVRYIFELNTAKVKDYVEYLKRINCEKNIEAKQNKMLLQKLQEQLHYVKERYKKDENELASENINSTKQLNRFTRQYNNMVKKYQKLVAASGKKYRAVWKMNDTQSRKIAKQLQQMDQYITERILHHQWMKGECPIPDLRERSRLLDPAFQPGQARPGPAGSSSSTSFAPSHGKRSEEEEEKVKETEVEDHRMELFFEKHVLSGLCDSSGFLAQDRVKKLLQTKLEGVDRNEQNFLKVKSILSTLGIRSETDLKEFLEFCALQVKMEGGSVNLHSQDILDQYLPPERIIEILKEYILHLGRTISSSSLSPKNNNKNDSQKKQSSRKLLERKNKAMKKKEIMEYWKQLENVIVPSKLKIWEHLKSRVSEYQKDLQRRVELVQANEYVRKQNQELMQLLQQQRRDKINEELYIPPTFKI